MIKTYVSNEVFKCNYFGVAVYKVRHNGMYNALCGAGGYLKAYTLQGIKELIRESLGK